MEKIDKAIEILQAFKENKTIESIYYEGSTDYEVLTTSGQIMVALCKDKPIRIKPQPTYRPYANAEEFLKASKEHGPYVKACDGGYIQIDRVYNDRIHWCHLNESHMLSLTFEEFLKQHTWADGSKCGILEQ